MNFSFHLKSNMTTTVKSENHKDDRVAKVAQLLDQHGKYADVQVMVGGKTFDCHKLILALKSTYFQSQLFPTSSPRQRVDQIVINNISYHNFDIILCFIYKGEVELSDHNVEDILRAADTLCLDELKQFCIDYMSGTLCAANCLRYWKLAELLNETKLSNTCKKLYLKEFVNISSSSDLRCMTEGMLKATLEDDDLNVDCEVDVCEILMRSVLSN
jgi:hypothetical protein